jgi:hypothetical protein
MHLRRRKCNTAACCAQKLIPETDVVANYNRASELCAQFSSGRDDHTELTTVTKRDKQAFNALARLSAAVGWVTQDTMDDMALRVTDPPRIQPHRPTSELVREAMYRQQQTTAYSFQTFHRREGGRQATKLPIPPKATVSVNFVNLLPDIRRTAIPSMPKSKQREEGVGTLPHAFRVRGYEMIRGSVALLQNVLCWCLGYQAPSFIPHLSDTHIAAMCMEECQRHLQIANHVDTDMRGGIHAMKVKLYNLRKD